MRNPNGTGSIFKKKGKSRKPYIVRAAAYLTEEGKYKRPIIGSAETLKEAKKMLFEFNSRNLNVDYADLKLIDLFNRWTESNHVKNIKTEETFYRYSTDFKSIFEDILECKFIFLDYKDYQIRLDKYAKNKGKAALTVLKSIYVDAIKNKIVSENIPLYLESSSQITKTVERVVFEDNFVRLLWKRYENINLKERYFVTGSKTEAGMNRQIPIHHLIFPIIKRFINDDKYLFKEQYDSLKYQFDKILSEYNTSGNLHSIRHTFITKMRRLKNESASKIKKIVGHREKDITDGVYTHWTIKELRDVINKLVY
jgi:integrase family protein